MIITMNDEIIERGVKTATVKFYLDHAELKVAYYKPVNGEYDTLIYADLSLEDANTIDAMPEDCDPSNFEGVGYEFAPEIGWNKAYENMNYIKEALTCLANAINSVELDSGNKAKVSEALDNIRQIKL